MTIVNRIFWTRDKGDVTQSFSYANNSQPVKYAAKWGGSVVDKLEVDEDIPDGEVWSYLENSGEITEELKEDKKFYIYVKLNDGWTLASKEATISNANSLAKNIISNNKKVVVLKKED